MKTVYDDTLGMDGGKRRMQKMQAVVLQDLSKTFPGGKEAVKGISLSLRQGEVFGFLGPNGAGKTTTVKMLNGMLTPSAGKCSVLGFDPSREPEKVHAVSGVLTEHAQMYDNMTGIQNLIFYAEIFGISKEEGRKRGLTLLEKLKLEEAGDQKLAAYSTGMRQRLSLARALIHRPEVLFLDEPTSGLDPESAQNVNQLIRELAQEKGTTVFLCTHQLRYAQEICTRFGLLEEGRLLAAGTLAELREKMNAGAELRVRACGISGNGKFTDSRIQRQWKRADGESAGDVFCTKIQSEAEIPRIVRTIVEAGGDIYGVEVKQPTLEDIYFALTAKGKEEEQ